MTFNKQALDQTIAHQEWNSLIYKFSPETIVNTYSYDQVMHTVGHLMIAARDKIVVDGALADSMRDFAVNLMILVRDKYSQKWWEDWKNEAYLGICCASVYRDAEAFQYCKSAYKSLNDPPQSLILAYISAGDGIDKFLSSEEIIKLTHDAIQKGITYQAALQMAYLAGLSGDREMAKYWKQKAAVAEQNECHTPVITPNVLKELFSTQGGKQNEI